MKGVGGEAPGDVACVPSYVFVSLSVQVARNIFISLSNRVPGPNTFKSPDPRALPSYTQGKGAQFTQEVSGRVTLNKPHLLHMGTWDPQHPASLPEAPVPRASQQGPHLCPVSQLLYEEG